MAIEIRAHEPSSYEPLVQLRMARLPRLRRAQAEWMFTHAETMELFDLRAAYDDGTLAGVGSALRGPWFPPGFAMVNVVVAHAHERKGAGGALHRALLESLPPDISTIGMSVDDEEHESLEIAIAHGYAVTQHGIESELELVDLPSPTVADGVTFEDVSALEFDDEEAVAAMLADSQTNPEADEGFVATLDDFRRNAGKSERPLAVLLRVDGAPAAIIVGEVRNGVLDIGYTGVARTFRGRNLAFALKQHGHLLAAEAGATLSQTMNEEANAGIRRVNAQLGYRVIGGGYRLRRAR